MTPLNNRGFTLIELSIVLVIIGLIVGGVLVGRDLVKAAGLRKAMQEVEMLNTAVNAFRNKYNCLPGDCPNATTFWGAGGTCPDTYWGGAAYDTVTCNGNGDGQIHDEEMFSFFAQLSNAKLINQKLYTTGCCPAYGGSTWAAGTPAAYKSAVFGGMYAGAGGAGYSIIPNDGDAYGVDTPWNYTFSHDGFSYWDLSGRSDPSNMAPFAPVMTPLDALSIDTKIDDGKPGTGIVQTWKQDWYSFWATASLPLCATTTDPTTAVYNTTGSTSNSCALLFRTQF